MTDLTDKWNKGELPSGWYWCNCYDEETKLLYYNGDCFELDDPETKNYYFFLLKDIAEITILAPVPTYEEWKALIDLYKEADVIIKKSDKENDKLKTDCKNLAQKLLQVKPELRGWLEVNFKEYL